MLIFIKILTIFKQSLFDRMIVQRRSRVWGHRTNGASLCAVIVSKEKLYALIEGISIFANITKNYIESWAYSCVQSGFNSLNNHLCSQGFFHIFQNLIVHRFNAIIDKNATRSFHK